MKPTNIKKYLEEQENPVEQYTFDAWYKKWINLLLILFENTTLSINLSIPFFLSLILRLVKILSPKAPEIEVDFQIKSKQ